MVFGTRWQALTREAELAAESLGIGASELGRANYAAQAHYLQAFFALSTGVERATKLAIAVDHALQNGGDFPQPNAIKEKYGHRLDRLLRATAEIAVRRATGVDAPVVPNKPIHDSIVKVLTGFAQDGGRYYDLEQALRKDSEGLTDPVRAWFDEVVIPIRELHLTTRQIERVRHRAMVMDALIGANSSVLHRDEQGNQIRTVFDGSLGSGLNAITKPWERMYVLQIARFLRATFGQLSDAAHAAGMAELADLDECFQIFSGTDKSLRMRKVWSIYRS